MYVYILITGPDGDTMYVQWFNPWGHNACTMDQCYENMMHAKGTNPMGFRHILCMLLCGQFIVSSASGDPIHIAFHPVVLWWDIWK